MGDQSHKTSAKPTGEATKKIKNPAPVVQAVLEAEPLALFADPVLLQRAMADPGGLPPAAISGLQRAVGNRRVQAMLTRADPAADLAAQIQKQAIEGYAERRAASDVAASGVAQRRTDGGGGVELSTAMTEEINEGMSRGGGRLPEDIQAGMKRNLGIANPEEIQVHTDEQADALSRALGARAFTTGRHIFFRQGEYDPGNTKGRALLYHEGVHTVQQGGVKGGAPQAKMVVNPPDDRYEREAEAVAEQAVLASESGGPRFVEPGARPKTTPHISQKDDEEREEGYGQQAGVVVEPVMAGPVAGVQRERGGKEEREEKEEEVREEEKEREQEESAEEKEEREKEAKEKGKEREEESKEETKEKGEAVKAEAKARGEEEGKPKEQKALPKIPKAAGFTPPPPKVDASEVESIDGDTAAAVKFDPDEFEFEEPEQEPLLPTWDQLAEGTVQLSMEEVQEEYRIRLGLAAGDPADFEGIDLTQGFNVEPGEPTEPTKSGPELVGEALGKGILGGLREGAQSWATDTLLEAATGKIKYADGLINLAKMAYDPKAWVQDNVFAIGDSFMAVGSAFADIASERTPFGVVAATLEAVIAIIDFIQSIIGLINQILTMSLWISKALVSVSNFLVATLPPIAVIIAFVPVFIFLWVPGVFSPIASFFSIAISWLDPLNTVISQVGTMLGLVKFQLQPFAIWYRTLDMLAYQGDSEEMEKKQQKLMANVQGFVQFATTHTLENAKNSTVKGINKRRDQRKIKKLEDRAATGDDPDLQARIAAKKKEFEEKYGESVDDFRSKSKKQLAIGMAKAAVAAPAMALGKALGIGKKEGKWALIGIPGGIVAVEKGMRGDIKGKPSASRQEVEGAAVERGARGDVEGKPPAPRRRARVVAVMKGLGAAIKAEAGELAKKFKERRSEVQQELRREQAVVRGRSQRWAEKVAEKIGRRTGAERPERVSSRGKLQAKIERATGKAEKWIGEPEPTETQQKAAAKKAKHLTAQREAEADARRKRERAQAAREAADAAEEQARQKRQDAQRAAKTKEDREKDAERLNKEAADVGEQARQKQQEAREAADAKRRHEDDARRLRDEAAAVEHDAVKQRKRAVGEELKQRRLEKEAGESEAAAKEKSNEADRLEDGLKEAESRAAAVRKEAEDKQRELNDAREAASKANQRLEEAKRRRDEAEEHWDRAVHDPKGKKSTALRNLELAERRLSAAQAEADAANKRTAKLKSELDGINARRQEAELEAKREREAAAKARREAHQLEEDAGRKRKEAREAKERRQDFEKQAEKLAKDAMEKRAAAEQAQQAAEDAEKRRRESEGQAKDLDDVAKKKREDAGKAQQDAEDAERRRQDLKRRISELEREARNKREEAELHEQTARESELIALREGYRAEPPDDKDLDDWIDKIGRWKISKWLDEPVFGGQRHGPGIIGTNIISWLIQTPWVDEEYKKARAKTDQALALREEGRYQEALDIVKDLDAKSWQKRADSLKGLLGPRWGREETIANFEKLANDIRSFYVYDPSKPPPSVGQRLKLLLNTLTPGLPAGAARVNAGATAFVVTLIERVGEDVETPVQDEIADFPQGEDKVEKDYYSLLPAAQGPISLAVRPKPVEFEVNGVKRTYTPRYFKVDKYEEEGLTRYEVWIGYESTLQFTSAPVTAAILGEKYRYEIKTDGGLRKNIPFIPTGGSLPSLSDVVRGLLGGNASLIFATGLPPGLGLSSNGGTATLEGTPTAAGNYDVVLRAEDRAGFSATQSFKLTVRARPQFTSTPETTTAYKGEEYNYAISATDPDTVGSRLTITAPTKPDWLSLTDNGDGTATLTGTPTDEHVGDHTVELKVEDDYGFTATQSFTLKVTEPAQPKRAGDEGPETTVQGKKEGWGTLPAGQSPVVQRQPADEAREEEEEDEGFISDADIAYQKQLAARATLLEVAPEPPPNMIERVQGAALAYEAVDAEEYDLALQQQQIGALMEHGQGQMVELEGAQKLTAVNKQGVDAQIQDAETQMEAQDQMQAVLSAQEGQAKETAQKGAEGQNIISKIFGQIMSAFGFGSAQGAGDNGAQSQSGAMKSGVQETSKATGGAAEATKAGQSSVASSQARTMKVKEGAEGARQELDALEDKLAADREENQEGLAELGEAAVMNEGDLESVRAEKERLREEHMQAVAEAEMWAEEHRFIREEIFFQLESEL